MKFDPIVAGMVRSDVEIVLEDCIRPHLGCECVDRTDLDAWAKHLAREVADSIEALPDIDGSFAEYAKTLFKEHPNQ